eukprot:7000028-Pyramimonas_sp.AAC.1
MPMLSTSRWSGGLPPSWMICFAVSFALRRVGGHRTRVRRRDRVSSASEGGGAEGALGQNRVTRIGAIRKIHDFVI